MMNQLTVKNAKKVITGNALNYPILKSNSTKKIHINPGGVSLVLKNTVKHVVKLLV